MLAGGRQRRRFQIPRVRKKKENQGKKRKGAEDEDKKLDPKRMKLIEENREKRKEMRAKWRRNWKRGFVRLMTRFMTNKGWKSSQISNTDDNKNNNNSVKHKVESQLREIRQFFYEHCFPPVRTPLDPFASCHYRMILFSELWTNCSSVEQKSQLLTLVNRLPQGATPSSLRDAAMVLGLNIDKHEVECYKIAHRLFPEEEDEEIRLKQIRTREETLYHKQLNSVMIKEEDSLVALHLHLPLWLHGKYSISKADLQLENPYSYNHPNQVMIPLDGVKLFLTEWTSWDKLKLLFIYQLLEQGQYKYARQLFPAHLETKLDKKKYPTRLVGAALHQWNTTKINVRFDLSHPLLRDIEMAQLSRAKLILRGKIFYLNPNGTLDLYLNILADRDIWSPSPNQYFKDFLSYQEDFPSLTHYYQFDHMINLSHVLIQFIFAFFRTSPQSSAHPTSALYSLSRHPLFEPRVVWLIFKFLWSYSHYFH